MVFAAGCAGGEVEPRVDGDAAPRDAADVAVQQDAPRDVPRDAVDTSVAPVDVTRPPGDGPAACTGNRDGVIERSEMAFPLGTSVLYASNRDGTTVSPVDTAGTTGASGRVWDFAAAVAQDTRLIDEVLAPTGQWWSATYPTATFASVVDRATNLLGVYRVSDTQLELLATVSMEQNRTNLAFTPPVSVLRFPLRVGDVWTQSVTGAGFLNYLPLSNLTAYTVRVDADGEVYTPAGRFRALRVYTSLDQSIPLTTIRVTRKTYAFVSECWGLVARVASVDNETAEEFRSASEYRRLGL